MMMWRPSNPLIHLTLTKGFKGGAQEFAEEDMPAWTWIVCDLENTQKRL
jgi:hypothetical protein